MQVPKGKGPFDEWVTLDTRYVVKAERMQRLCINYLNLPLLLRELWRSHVMPRLRVMELIGEIERKDNVVIKNRELIFK